MPNKPDYLRQDTPDDRNPFYNSSYWRKRRKWWLKNNPACVRCGRAATCVDHIDGDTKNNKSSNYQSMCHKCHSRKTYEHDGGLSR